MSETTRVLGKILLAAFYFLLRFWAAVGEEHYTNEWVVHVDGGDTMADIVADEFGYVNKGKVSIIYPILLILR